MGRQRDQVQKRERKKAERNLFGRYWYSENR